MKYKNKYLLFVLLALILLVCMYLFIPGIYNSLSPFFLGEYKPIIVVALAIVAISVVGFGVVFSDIPKYVEKNVYQSPKIDENKIIIVKESKGE